MQKTSNGKLMGGAGLFLMIAVLCQGCAAVKPQGNLTDSTIALKQCQDDISKFWWEKPGFNWHNYTKIILDPTVLEIDQNNFKTEELQTAVDGFRKIIIKGLSSEYMVVNDPGPGVLRIRSIITDINTSNPVLNTLTTVAFFLPLDMGGAAIKVDFFDSITGERVAAMVDEKCGTPLQFKSGFSRFGHAKGAFEAWAKELKLALATNP
jgi:hypothetical protein